METKAPPLSLDLGPLDLVSETLADGTILSRSPEAEPGYARSVIDWLHHWSEAAPDRVFLAERPAPGAPGWTEITYAEAFARVRTLAAALLKKDVSPERPVAVLSANSIDHALVALATIMIGVPYAPVSPAYSLIGDFSRLKAVLAQLTPGLVYAADGEKFSAAIAAAVSPDVEIVISRNPPPRRAATLLSDLGDPDIASAARAHEAISPDTIAKILFTSGSTGTPKGVITTQRMLCSNQAMIESFLRFLCKEPPVLADWLPWHHSFGGNQNFGLVLRHGGTLFIDAGNLTPAGLGESLRNLREISPTLTFNVPAGYQALIAHLNADRPLAERFFSRLRMAFVASAPMSEELFEAFQALAVASCGARIPMVSGYGATETGPAALFSLKGHSGQVGLPLPGVRLKLAPRDGKYECLLKGPAVSPGYWRDAAKTAASFDDEGYYRSGDALAFADPAHPAEGFVYDGRLAEDFMLASGVWVSTGRLRAQAIEAFAPYARDVVVAGRGENDVGLLVFPDFNACRELAKLAADADPAAIVAHEAVRNHFKARLERLAAGATGASNRITLLILLESAPSAANHEMTDKGSINQRAVLDRRGKDVAALYAPASARVIRA